MFATNFKSNSNLTVYENKTTGMQVSQPMTKRVGSRFFISIDFQIISLLL